MSHSKYVRRIIAGSLLPLLLACGRDGTGPQNLTPAEVGGVYRVCTLGFQPNQALLPSVDVRAVAMDTASGAVTPARLFVDNQTTGALLEYSAPGSTLPRRHNANYQTGARTVVLTFGAAAPLMTELLLPGTMELDFQVDPNRLSFTRTQHDVPRQSYATMANVSTEGLAEMIRGTITAEFRAGTCP